MNILVTSEEFLEKPGKHLDLLKLAGHIVLPAAKEQVESGKGIKAKIKDVEAAIVDNVQINEAVLESAHKLKVLSKIGSTVENIDVAKAAEKNIVVTFTPDLSYLSKAELAVALMFTLSRNIIRYAGMVQAGQVRELPASELWGKTLGLVGLDMLGKTVARRALGLGMRIVAFDTVRDKDFADRMGIRFASLDDLFQVSDFVSFHYVPERIAGKMVTAANMAKMKRGAYLVNTSSSEIAVESDIIKALKEERIAGYATSQPGNLALDPALAASGKLVILPEIAVKSVDIFLREAKMAVENVLRVFAGEPPHGQVHTPAPAV